MSLMPNDKQTINSLEWEVNTLKAEIQMYKKYIENLNKGKLWKFVVKEDGIFYCQPQFDIKVGESAWPFKTGEYVTLRQIITEKEENKN